MQTGTYLDSGHFRDSISKFSEAEKGFRIHKNRLNLKVLAQFFEANSSHRENFVWVSKTTNVAQKRFIVLVRMINQQSLQVKFLKKSQNFGRNLRFSNIVQFRTH